MEQLKPGDIVRITPEWLDEGENPDLDYIVVENFGDGKIDIYTKTHDYGFGVKNTVADYMVYKVGYINENNTITYLQNK